MENLTKELKQEILNAISDLEINSYDFEHCLEDSIFTTASSTFEIETKNLRIELELIETVKWQDYDYNETENIEISNIEVSNENGLVDLTNLSENDILKNLNY